MVRDVAAERVEVQGTCAVVARVIGIVMMLDAVAQRHAHRAVGIVVVMLQDKPRKHGDYHHDRHHNMCYATFHIAKVIIFFVNI